MEHTQISKDKLLELLYEAYQAGCFGYMELQETQCKKIVDQCKWEHEVPLRVELPPSETTITLPYTYDSTPGILSFGDYVSNNHLMPAQQQQTITHDEFTRIQQQMAQQEHVAMLIREQTEDFQVFTLGDLSNVEIKSVRETVQEQDTK